MRLTSIPSPYKKDPPSIHDALKKEGNTKIIQAIEYFIINKGVNLNQEDKNGNTIFKKSILKHCWKLTYLLLKHNKNPKKRVRFSFLESDLKFAIEKAYEELPWRGSIEDIAASAEIIKQIFRKLRNRNPNISLPNGNTLFHQSIQDRNLPIFKLLLGKGVNVNIKNSHGYTPLEIALDAADLAIIQTLLEQGADPNICLPDGTPLLIKAYQEADQALFDLLLSAHNLDINVQDTNGNTLLYYILQDKNLPILKFLLEKGLDINSKNKDGYTLLQLAFEHKDQESIQILLSHGTDPNILFPDGTLLLIKAYQEDDQALFDLLLTDNTDNNVDINAHDANKDTLLHHLIQDHDSDTLNNIATINSLLIEKKANPNLKNSKGKKPLHLALEEDHWDIIYLLLQQGANPISIHNKHYSKSTSLLTAACEAHQWRVVDLILNKIPDRHPELNPELKARNPIYLACRAGKIEIVRTLLKKGVIPDQVSIPSYYPSHIKTLLHLAIYKNQPELIKLLLEKGANPNEKDNNDVLPLDKLIAAKEIKLDIIEILLTYHAQSNLIANKPYLYKLLTVAIKETRWDIIKLLITNKIVEATIAQNRTTLLHIAIIQSQWDIAEFLLENGADPNATTKEGNTVLHTLLNEVSPPQNIIELLLQKGAEIDQSDSDGDTPLHLSLYEPHDSEMTTLLLKEGADPNIQNNEGNAALHMAIQKHCDQTTIELLLEEGANPNQPNEENNTPLDLAIYTGNTAIVKLLLEKGANPQIVENKMPPLAIAITKGYQTIAKLLLEKGANPHIVHPESGKALLAWLIDTKKWPLAELLLDYYEDNLSINENTLSELKEVLPSLSNRYHAKKEKSPNTHSDILLHELLKEEYEAYFKIYFQNKELSFDPTNTPLRSLLYEILEKEVKYLDKIICSINKPSRMASPEAFAAYSAEYSNKSIRLTNKKVLLWEKEEEIEKAEQLLEQINPFNDTYTLLVNVLEAGQINILKLLIKKLKFEVNPKNSGGYTLLHSLSKKESFAFSEEQRLEVIQFLLEEGADPNLLLPHTNTHLLQNLFDTKNWEVLKLFLEHGANPNIEINIKIDNEMETPPLIYKAPLLYSICEAFENTEEASEELTASTKKTIKEIIELLLQQGAHMNKLLDPVTNTPLLEKLFMNKSWSLVKLLLKYTEKPNVSNESMFSLYTASQQECCTKELLEVSTLILQKGIEMNMKNKKIVSWLEEITKAAHSHPVDEPPSLVHAETATSKTENSISTPRIKQARFFNMSPVPSLPESYNTIEQGRPSQYAITADDIKGIKSGDLDINSSFHRSSIF